MKNLYFYTLTYSSDMYYIEYFFTEDEAKEALSIVSSREDVTGSRIRKCFYPLDDTPVIPVFERCVRNRMLLQEGEF